MLVNPWVKCGTAALGCVWNGSQHSRGRLCHMTLQFFRVIPPLLVKMAAGCYSIGMGSRRSDPRPLALESLSCRVFLFSCPGLGVF